MTCVFHYDFSIGWNPDDVCQNIRQDFDICQNIDHQKTTKTKKETKEKINKTHTNKQASQTNKQKRKQRNEKNKQPNKQRRLFFWFGPMQWLEPLRAAKRYK